MLCDLVINVLSSPFGHRNDRVGESAAALVMTSNEVLESFLEEHPLRLFHHSLIRLLRPMF